MSGDVKHPTPEEIEESRFVAAVKRHREALEWSQGKLAREMNDLGWDSFHQTTIRRLEDGQRAVRLGEARALAKIFGTTVSQMMAPTEIESLMSSLLADLRELHSAENAVRGGLLTMDAKRQSLRHSFDLAEKNIDPDVWRDAALSDLYQQITNKARGRVKQTTSQFVNEVLRDLRNVAEKQSDANEEALRIARGQAEAKESHAKMSKNGQTERPGSVDEEHVAEVGDRAQQ